VGTVPGNLGINKVYPPLGAKSYTELVGSDEYLRMLVVWGYGPLRIEDIKLGETLITEYNDVEIETKEGWSTDTDLTLFPSSVNQETVSTILTSTTGRVTKTAQANVDELSVDIVFPSGLVQFNSAGTRVERSVSLQVQYRETGTEDWTDVPGTKPLSVVGTSISTSDYEDGTYSVYVSNPGAVISIVLGTDPISGSYRIGEVVISSSLPTVTNLEPEECTGLVCSGYAKWGVV